MRGVIAQLAEDRLGTSWLRRSVVRRPRILLNLVTSASVNDPLGAGWAAPRGASSRSNGMNRTRTVAEKLVEARLLTTGRDEATRTSPPWRSPTKR